MERGGGGREGRERGEGEEREKERREGYREKELMTELIDYCKVQQTVLKCIQFFCVIIEQKQEVTDRNDKQSLVRNQQYTLSCSFSN